MNKITLTLTALFALTLSAFAANPKDANNPWFKKHDIYGDGVISKKEFITTQVEHLTTKKKFTKEKATERAEKGFARADKNKDGKLTVEEFFADK